MINSLMSNLKTPDIRKECGFISHMLLLYNNDYDHMSFRVTQLKSLKQVTTSGAETEAAKAAVPLMAI